MTDAYDPRTDSLHEPAEIGALAGPSDVADARTELREAAREEFARDGLERVDDVIARAAKVRDEVERGTFAWAEHAAQLDRAFDLRNRYSGLLPSTDEPTRHDRPDAE